ncbi:hypothetical protein M422DRAFT_40821 [Sphaerobolus stellatus SS14]|nr:hypothetical protein M422DRAFT_40821 [Sphaerobolus stellatus SS14]
MDVDDGETWLSPSLRSCLRSLTPSTPFSPPLSSPSPSVLTSSRDSISSLLSSIRPPVLNGRLDRARTLHRTPEVPPGFDGTDISLLGYLDNSGSYNEHLDISKFALSSSPPYLPLSTDDPLARGFPLIAGSVPVIVPNVPPCDTYVIAFLGDSGNISPEFHMGPIGVASPPNNGTIPTPPPPPPTDAGATQRCRRVAYRRWLRRCVPAPTDDTSPADADSPSTDSDSDPAPHPNANANATAPASVATPAAALHASILAANSTNGSSHLNSVSLVPAGSIMFSPTRTASVVTRSKTNANANAGFNLGVVVVVDELGFVVGGLDGNGGV